MVRREEQPWQTRATVFLDNRAGAHRGEGAASSLETAVVVAASVAAHLTSRGYTVRLVTAAGEDPATSWQHDDAAVTAGHLLEALAMVQALPSTILETNWLREQGAGSLTVAIVGGLTGPDLAVMRRVQHHAGGALAVALDIDAWGATKIAGGGSSAWLLQQGWRAVGLTPEDRIEQAWQELGAARAWRGGRGAVAHASS